jgi:hypothetical protein
LKIDGDNQIGEASQFKINVKAFSK